MNVRPTKKELPISTNQQTSPMNQSSSSGGDNFVPTDDVHEQSANLGRGFRQKYPSVIYVIMSLILF